MAGRAQTHNALQQAVYDAAVVADVGAQQRSKTYVLLMQQFTAQECQTLFPRRAKKVHLATARRILAELGDAKLADDRPRVMKLQEDMAALIASQKDRRGIWCQMICLLHGWGSKKAKPFTTPFSCTCTHPPEHTGALPRLGHETKYEHYCHRPNPPRSHTCQQRPVEV